MPITILGLLENVETYEGKNGFGANITMSCKLGRKTKRLEFRTKSKDLADQLEENLDLNIKIIILLEQSNFGLRLGDLISIEEIKEVA